MIALLLTETFSSLRQPSRLLSIPTRGKLEGQTAASNISLQVNMEISKDIFQKQRWEYQISNIKCQRISFRNRYGAACKCEKVRKHSGKAQTQEIEE